MSSASAALAGALSAARASTEGAGREHHPVAARAAAAGCSGVDVGEGLAVEPHASGSGNARRCYLDPPERADALLVVFSGHFPDAAEKGYEVPFEFGRFLGRHPLGVHTLFLRDTAMAWYLTGIEGIGSSVDEVADFIANERQQLGAERLFTLGSSMGGYAALLFGHILKADTVLAFGPQIYLDQATRREMKVAPYSYESSLAQVEHLAGSRGLGRYLKLTSLLPLEVGMAHIHLGQNEPGDINQARGFNDQKNVKFVVWPGGNHMVVRSLRDEGKLLQVLCRHFAAASKVEDDSPCSAEHAEALRVRGNDLVKSGKYGEAVEAYTAALHAGVGESHHLVLANRSLCLLKLGRAEEAWHDADSAVRLDPKYAKAFYRRAQCEVERGFIASAVKSIAQARALDPADKALIALEADLRKRVVTSPGGPSAGAPFAAYCE